MPTMTIAPIKDSRLAVRMSAVEKELLERAAAATHQTLTEFVVKTCLEAADAVLADQTVFAVSDEQFDWLKQLVNKPFDATDGWDTLMSRKSTFQYD